eukprot:g3798.t1
MASSRMKWLSLGVLMLQNTATPLIFRAAMTATTSHDRFEVVHAVFTQELIKCVLSLGLLFHEQGGDIQAWLRTLSADIAGKPIDTLKLSVPAVLYFIQNMCLQLASANLPAAVFQVTYQGKSLVVAFCSVVMLGKMLTRVRWLAIALMGFGLVVVQLAKSKEAVKGVNDDEQNIMLGLLLTVLGCFCSGFASVYFEKMMKTPTASSSQKPSLSGESERKTPSMWVRNVQLAGFSMLIGALHMGFSSFSRVTEDPANNSDGGFFHGFSNIVWLMVFNNAFGGLCVAMVIKYADNILKGFACALATILASVASVYFFGFHLRFTFLLGMAIVLWSSLLYGGTIRLGKDNDWWNTEPPLCAGVRSTARGAQRASDITPRKEDKPDTSV